MSSGLKSKGSGMMVELFDVNLRMEKRQSSKGNQQKWLQEGVWYKADYFGTAFSKYVWRKPE